MKKMVNASFTCSQLLVNKDVKNSVNSTVQCIYGNCKDWTIPVVLTQVGFRGAVI